MLRYDAPFEPVATEDWEAAEMIVTWTPTCSSGGFTETWDESSPPLCRHVSIRNCATYRSASSAPILAWEIAIAGAKGR